MWKPIADAPKDGTQLLVKGGTYHCEAETYPEEYPMNWVALVNWNDSDNNWRGEQSEAYGEYYVYSPTHYITKSELLALPEVAA